MNRDLLVLCAAVAAGIAVLMIRPARPPEGVPGGRTGTSRADQVLARLRPAAAPPITELLSALAAELSAGQPTGPALESAVVGLEPHPCPQAIAACRSGADVAAALRSDARAPGAHALRGLAACWEVSERSGAGLAVAVSRLSASLRAVAEADGELAGEVAAVRASARMLAGLPLLGLLIGQWIGAEPLAWLTGSWVGRAVLLTGVALQLLGMAWLRRMVSATRGRL